MRTRKEIEKDVIKIGFLSRLINKFTRASIINQQLQLEVLLDIRDLLMKK